MILAQAEPPPPSLSILPLLALLLIVASVVMRHRTRKLYPGSLQARVWLIISFVSVNLLGSFISVVMRAIASKSNRFAVDIVDLLIGVAIAALVNFVTFGRWSNTFGRWLNTLALLFIGPEKLFFGKLSISRMHRFYAMLAMTITAIILLGGFKQPSVISLFLTFFFTILILVRLFAYIVQCVNCGMMVPFLCDWSGRLDKENESNNSSERTR